MKNTRETENAYDKRHAAVRSNLEENVRHHRSEPDDGHRHAGALRRRQKSRSAGAEEDRSARRCVIIGDAHVDTTHSHDNIRRDEEEEKQVLLRL